MGKPFQSELESLDYSYKWASEQSTDRIRSFLRDCFSLPLYAIGSGGSFTAAVFASSFHQYIGTMAKPVTPLEFLSTDYLSDYAVLVLTASGRNSDILNAFTKAAQCEPRSLLGICLLKDSPLSRVTKEYSFTDIAEYDIPSGKDGFLATNTLLAIMVLLAKAYIETYNVQIELPRSLKELSHPTQSAEQFTSNVFRSIQPLLSKRTIVILHDSWTRAAAYDLESKLSESGIANAQIADFRNFAHGRHNWLDKNQDDTGIIALASKETMKLSRRILDLVPKNIPAVQFDSKHTNPLASLDLLIPIMYIVGFIGKARKIDPGRPGVPEFGRRIYNLKPNSSSISRNATSSSQLIAISRKIRGPVRSLPNKENAFWQSSYTKFTHSLAKKKFNAVIFDYDGTLCDSRNRFRGITQEIARNLIRLLENEISVGIATGRGKSVRKDLQNKIPRKYWSKTYIGYYNCADIGSLDEDKCPNLSLPIDPSIQKISQILRYDKVFEEIASYEIRPKQISVEPKGIQSIRSLYYYLENLLSIDRGLESRIMMSTHSIDIVADNVSKTNLVEFIQGRNKTSDYHILRIGDKGRWPGNDYYLLSDPDSLSVDDVSADSKACWNLLPPGYRGEQGVRYYFELMKPQKGYLKLDI